MELLAALVSIAVSIIGAAVGFIITYFVIKAAVKNAILEIKHAKLDTELKEYMEE